MSTFIDENEEDYQMLFQKPISGVYKILKIQILEIVSVIDGLRTKMNQLKVVLSDFLIRDFFIVACSAFG